MSKNYGSLQHGKLKILSKIDAKSYLAKCECGTETTISQHQISSNRKHSCGCLVHKGVFPGATYNSLKILEESKIGKTLRLKVQCFCGSIFSTLKSRIIRKETKSCGCLKRDKHIGEISQQFWSRIVHGAEKRRSRKINLSIERKYVWDLFLKQDRKCIYTGLELHFPIHYKQLINSDYTASLDRIDSSKGYIEGNVQWVHKCVNVMKNQLSHDTFVKIVNQIARIHPSGDLLITDMPKKVYQR